MKTSCEFRFGFWDVTARDDATFLPSENQPYARIEDINREEGITFPDVVTLEPDFGWPCNGSKVWFPAAPDAYTWGWWSVSQSGADCAFENPPTLTVNFMDDDGQPTPHSSAGITLHFYATLPGVINIKWYGMEGDLLADQDFSPDQFEYFCEYQVENYSKVVITVQSMTAAYRYLRCTFILFGLLEVLNTARVEKAELCEEIHPAALTLPINTISLTFYTSGGHFSLLNLSGAYRLFQYKQQVNAYATVDGERRLIGIYYLQEASGFEDGMATLSLVDIIGLLDTLDFNGGIYTATPIRELLDAILGPEDVIYELDPSFEEVTLTGYLPICSKRAALQQIAVAIGAIIDTTRSTVMRIYPCPDLGTAVEVGPERKIIGHKVTLEALVTQVDMTAHAYQVSEEVKEISKSVLSAGQHRITFNAPAIADEVTGGELVETHPNFVVVKVEEPGEVIITGRQYVDNTTIYTVVMDHLPAGAKSSVKTVKDATLVDSSKAMAAARRIYDYYQRRYTDEGQVLPGDEVVAQAVEVRSFGGRSITGTIQRLTIDMAGGYITKWVVRGA